MEGSAGYGSPRGAGASLGQMPTMYDPPVPSSARRRAESRKELLFSPGRSARRDMARAERSQAMTRDRGMYGHGMPPPPLP